MLYYLEQALKLLQFFNTLSNEIISYDLVATQDKVILSAKLEIEFEYLKAFLPSSAEIKKVEDQESTYIFTRMWEE